MFENWPAAGVRDECSNSAGVSLRDSQVNFSGRPAVVSPSTQFDLDAFVNFSCIESVKRDGMFYNDLVKPPDVRASGQRASDVNNVPGCIAALKNHHRTFTPIVIGGLRSQMNFDGWSRELSFEPDTELREYLRKGIFSGFDIVDRDAVIEPYERQNYNSVLQGNAHSFIDQLICDELQQSKLVITSGKPACVHAVGAVPKPDGKYRPITDCKSPIGGSINNYMESTFHTFSCNTVDNVCESMSRQCFMATVDIAAAYRSIAISPDQWKYQGVSWKVNGVDTYITDTRLCFGLRCAPYVFTQISDFVVKCLARRGFHRVISYLDDFLLFGDSRVECIRAQSELIHLLGDLGFQVAWHKCSSPSQRTRYLGIVFDSVQMTLSLPPDKVEKLHAELNFFVNRLRASKRQLQRLCGVLAHCAKVVRGGRIFSRRIIDMLKSLPEGNPRIRLTDEFRADLAWWADFAEVFNGRAAMIDRNYGLGPVIFTDSSLNGYGVVHGSDWLAGYFSSECLPLGVGALIGDHRHWINVSVDDCDNINVLELIPLWLAAHRYGRSWTNRQVICYTDNTQVISVINRGRSANKTCMMFIRDIFWCSVLYNFHLIAHHIPGVRNVTADMLSRITNTNDLSCICDVGLCCRQLPPGSG